MSQDQLAEKANMSRSHLSAIEAPGMIRGMSMETFFNIADALDVEPAKLINASMFSDSIIKKEYATRIVRSVSGRIILVLVLRERRMQNEEHK